MDSVEARTYLAALKMLARRELSRAQIRTRLVRREHDPAHIETAIARLSQDGAVNDTRTALAIARTAALVRGHGARRARRQIDAAGIDAAIAETAIREVFGELDEDALLRAALARRLRGRTTISDQREMARLFRYLIGQGFASGKVVKLLRAALRGDQPGDNE